jgi:hypothetical protein
VSLTPGQALFDAETVLNPVVVQVMEMELVVETPVPVWFQVQPLADGEHPLDPVALKLRLELVWPAVGPETLMLGGGGGGGGGPPESTTIAECRKTCCSAPRLTRNCGV